MKATLSFVLLFSFGQFASEGAAQTNDALSNSLVVARNALSELQNNVSAYDMRLVEPLNSVAEEQMRLGQFDQAYRTLDRATQIVRINEGLFTPRQNPLLHKKIDTLVNLGNWDDARSQLDHLVYLYTKKQKYATPELLEGISQLAAVHLRGISEDGVEYQGFHFGRVSAGYWIALAIGEALWGKEDLRLVPLIYNVLQQFHLEYVAINRSGRTGQEIRTVIPGSNWIREVSEMRQYYLSTSSGLIDKLKTIYSAEQQFDQEALAMVDLYRADWLALFDADEEALSAYSTAYESLLGAGVGIAELDDFFSTPRLLPEPQFYATLGLAASVKPSLAAIQSIEIDSLPETKLHFAEWSSTFPYVQQPSSLGEPQAQLDELAIFSFSIGGFPDIPRLLKGRRPLGIGAVENVTAVSDMPESAYDERQLLERVSSLRFRPKLVRGVPHEIDVTLVYALAASY